MKDNTFMSIIMGGLAIIFTSLSLAIFAAAIRLIIYLFSI